MGRWQPLCNGIYTVVNIEIQADGGMMQATTPSHDLRADFQAYKCTQVTV